MLQKNKADFLHYKQASIAQPEQHDEHVVYTDKRRWSSVIVNFSVHTWAILSPTVS